ncbi:MAG: adenylate/guanylate cyclase domain-containing protein [Bacteroidetes bacterium]|nr:adenylate/guanylate cyclase domain-containing protein [Bacteroidota bacterium]
MCAGGIPTPNTTNPIDVVKSGMAFIEALHGLNDIFQQKGLPQINFRVGIHSGPLISGIVGRKKFAYDIWGDTVNIAARLEQSGVPGKVNISGMTYELIKDSFNCSYRGKVDAKNKGKIDMYFVENII